MTGPVDVLTDRLQRALGAAFGPEHAATDPVLRPSQFADFQANIRIIAATAKKLGMSMDNVVTTVAGHGNTSAASVPLAFDVAVRDGRIQRGQTVLMEAFGGGFTWGSVLVRF